MKKKSTNNSLCVFSLETLASLLDIPGGTDAMERLLLAAGFLTGAYRSSNPHLPYQRYLDRNFFLIIDGETPKIGNASTFCVTNKGLAPIFKALAAFGIRMTYPDDF